VENAFIVEEVKRKAKILGSGKNTGLGEEKALLSHEKSRGSNGRSRKPVKKCYYCDRPGHLEKDCWEKDPSKRPSRANKDGNTNMGGQAMGLVAQEDHKR